MGEQKIQPVTADGAIRSPIPPMGRLGPERVRLIDTRYRRMPPARPRLARADIQPPYTYRKQDRGTELWNSLLLAKLLLFFFHNSFSRFFCEDKKENFNFILNEILKQFICSVQSLRRIFVKSCHRKLTFFCILCKRIPFLVIVTFYFINSCLDTKKSVFFQSSLDFISLPLPQLLKIVYFFQ